MVLSYSPPDMEPSLLRIATSLINEKDADRGINFALETLGKMAKADRAYLFQFKDEGRTFGITHEWCARGIDSKIMNPAPDLANLRTADFPCVADYLSKGKDVVVTDVLKLPPEAAMEKKFLLGAKIRSFAVVPLFLQDRLFAFTGFDDTRKCRAWDEHDLNFLRLGGYILLSFIERMIAEQKREQLFLQLENAVRQRTQQISDLSRQVVSIQENERKKLAMELHDWIYQGLIIPLGQIRNLEEQLEGSRSLLLLLEQLEKDLLHSQEEIKRIINDLHPHLLEKLGLKKAISAYLHELGKRNNFEVTFRDFSQIEYEPDELCSLYLFRIMQEAMNNTCKHSAATRVSVTVDIAPGSFYLEVKDNGRGFLKESTAFKRGIQGMLERAAMLGCDLVIESHPGKGTTITLEGKSGK
jgi:signal transduction histidine kinase